MYRRQSANVMNATCSETPFFSVEELSEIALLAQLNQTRRKTLEAEAAIKLPADRPSVPEAGPAAESSDTTWRLMELAGQFEEVRSALISAGGESVDGRVIAFERTTTIPQLIAFRLTSTSGG
jgi:hypothetical protein